MNSFQTDTKVIVMLSITSLMTMSFGFGYLISQYQNQSTSFEGSEQNTMDTQHTSSSEVKPRGFDEQKYAKSHSAIPNTDHHGHPTFNCAMIKKSLSHTDQKKALTLQDVHEQHTKLNGEMITIRAIVVGAYPNIMNTNWYHLCDAPRGKVFVVSSKQITGIGQVITAQGILKVNHQVGKIYTFPLFIESAKLEGKNVQDAPPSVSNGVMAM